MKGAHPDFHRLGLEQAALSLPRTRPGSASAPTHLFLQLSAQPGFDFLQRPINN